VSAIESILDRGHGKPKQQIEANVDLGLGARLEAAMKIADEDRAARGMK
jgi:hypothetical protein